MASETLIFSYLALFPLGQIPKIGGLNIIDVIPLLSLLFINIKNLKRVYFLYACLFSLVFSLSLFNVDKIYSGVLYFLRLVSYFGFYFLIRNKLTKVPSQRSLYFNSLILAGVAVAVLGWVQYLFLPDTRAFIGWGWDDHYARLISTFLDPAFTGIIFVLTFILITAKFIQNKKTSYIGLAAFIFFSILFTYSRASYIALGVGSLTLAILSKKVKIAFITILALLLFIPLLPQPGGEGVNLARTSSINQKFISWQQGLNLFQTSPVFGIGFNNTCQAKLQILKAANPQSHSCSGIESSPIFILVTTGVLGFTLLSSLVWKVVSHVDVDTFGQAFLASVAALLVHSLFTNTLFYPAVMGWMAFMVALTKTKIVKE